MEYRWYVIGAMTFFVVVFAAIGADEWRKQERLERVQIACLTNHTVAECKELK